MDNFVALWSAVDPVWSAAVRLVDPAVLVGYGLAVCRLTVWLRSAVVGCDEYGVGYVSGGGICSGGRVGYVVLIPYDTADLLEKHFDWHYGDDGTEVSIKEKYYLIEYQSGVVNGSFDSERDVVESEDWLDYFIIKRVDYYLHRSSPMWSLQFASIKAWFPSSCDKKSFRVPCVVYHAPDARSFINVCKNCNLQPLPSGCPLSELIMENTALISEKKDLTLNISKMSETVTNKKRIDLPVNDDQA
ncbi:hypothetical protein Tco_1300406 [Tanacetum coccineum]